MKTNKISTNLRKITILFLIIALYYPSYSQVYTGQIFDLKTKTPLSYVNIFIPKKGVGTVTDENGKYSLNLINELDNDTLQFSLIGYKSEIIPIKRYKSNYETSNAMFFLEESTFNLSEVVVKPKNIVSVVTGNTISKINKNTCQPIFTLLDSVMSDVEKKELKNIDEQNKYYKAFPEKYIEVGTLFEIKKRETFIDKIQFQFCENNFDSIKLRLNIYSNLNDFRLALILKGFDKYESVLNKPIYFTVKKNCSTVDIDLKPYNLSVTDDFIVTIETIKPEDYKKIKVPFIEGFGGEDFVFGLYKQVILKMPIIKMGCNVTTSYEKTGNWFSNLFD